MNLLDNKIEKKIKSLEEVDQLNTSNYQELSNLNSNKKTQKDNQNIQKIQTVKDNNNLIFENIYSDFDDKNNNHHFYYQNFKDWQEFWDDDVKKEKEKGSNSDFKKNNNKKYQKKKSKYQIKFDEPIPKGDTVIDRLIRFGVNIKLKREKILKDKEIQSKKESVPKILEKSKNIIRDPNSFAERLYYNYKKGKKNVKVEQDNLNFTYHPSINKKSKKIAEGLGPTSMRLFEKKKIQKEEIEKQAIDGYKNLKNDHSLYLDNNYIHIRKKNKNLNTSAKKIICKLYNKGIEIIKKREINYQNNLLNKSLEYKKYPFQPNIIKLSKQPKNIKLQSTSKLNEDMYKNQVEWKIRKTLENYKKRQEEEDFFINYTCTFKPNIAQSNLKDDEKIIKYNIKDMQNYVTKRRKQIQDKENEEKLKRGYSSNTLYGFTLKDLYYKPTQNLRKENKNLSPFVNLDKSTGRRVKNKIIKINNFDCIIPPLSKRIFCYYNNSGELNKSVKNNIFNKINYSKINFIEAVNSLHTEIENLNI